MMNPPTAKPRVIASSPLESVEFEIFGKVQRVFFRKYTKAKADELKIKGWVQNTPTGTVIGQAQGPQDKINKMKSWLQTTGSPKSRIERVEFKNQKTISALEFTSFEISSGSEG